VTWNGLLLPGASVTITIPATINAGTAGTVVSNQGTVNFDANRDGTNEASALTDDPGLGGASDPTVFTVVAPADLSLTLTDSPDPVAAGTNLTYTATVTNLGPAAAQGVTVTMPVPANTTFVSGTVAGGGTCAAGANVVCTYTGNVLAGAGNARASTIIFSVGPAVPSGTVISATATAATTSNDPVAANNTASTTTTVNASADLVIALTSSTAQTLINVPVTFTATSQNLGPSDAQNVSITLTLSPDFRYSSHTATGATCTAPQIGNTGAIVCTWAGATAPGVTRTLAVVAFSNVEGTTPVNASTTSPTPDPVANNNATAVTVTVGYPFNEIPTLGQFGLMLLGLLVGLMGFVAIRRQS